MAAVPSECPPPVFCVQRGNCSAQNPNRALERVANIVVVPATTVGVSFPRHEIYIPTLCQANANVSMQ